MPASIPIRSARRTAAALLLAGAALGVSPSAGAFCRTRTCEFRNDVSCEVDEETGCSTVGAFIYWGTPCISYAVQRDGSSDEGIPAAELDQLVADGLDAWSDLSCPGGGTPELSAGSQGPIACDQVEYDCNSRDDNSNIVMFRDRFVNTGYGLRFGVIALTTLTANLVSGELFDADIEINSRDEDFEIDAPGGVGIEPEDARDLRGVVNHELGHLLGLSHSEERGALMRAAYEGTAAPGQDDTEAMCETMGAAAQDPACNVPALPADTECLGSDTNCTSQGDTETDSGGCACGLVAAGEQRNDFLAVGALALGFAWRSRRRRSMGRRRSLARRVVRPAAQR